MKKIFAVLLICALTLSSSGLVFADGGGESTDPFIKNKDTIVYVDGGAYDLINNVSEIEKKNKIAEYWLTPAYTEYRIVTMKAQDKRSQGALFGEESTDLSVLKMLIQLPTDQLDNKIEQLKEDAAREIINKENIVATDEFINSVENISPELASQLSNTQARDQTINLKNSNTNISPYQLMSFYTRVEAASKNVNGYSMATLLCGIDWITDGVTISRLYPDTTYSVDFVYSVGGMCRNEQFIKKAGGIDRGYVQKGLSIISTLFPGAVTGEPTGVLSIDVKLNAGGYVEKQYGEYISCKAYNDYNWVNP